MRLVTAPDCNDVAVFFIAAVRAIVPQVAAKTTLDAVSRRTHEKVVRTLRQYHFKYVSFLDAAGLLDRLPAMNPNGIAVGSHLLRSSHGHISIYIMQMPRAVSVAPEDEQLVVSAKHQTIAKVRSHPEFHLIIFVEAKSSEVQNTRCRDVTRHALLVVAPVIRPSAVVQEYCASIEVGFHWVWLCKVEELCLSAARGTKPSVVVLPDDPEPVFPIGSRSAGSHEGLEGREEEFVVAGRGRHWHGAAQAMALLQGRRKSHLLRQYNEVWRRPVQRNGVE